MHRLSQRCNPPNPFQGLAQLLYAKRKALASKALKAPYERHQEAQTSVPCAEYHMLLLCPQ